MIVFIMTYLFIGMCTCIGCLLYDYQLSSAKNIDEYLDWKDIEDLSQYIVMGIVWPITLLIDFIVILMPFIFKKLVIVFILCLKIIGIKFDKEDDKKK